MSGYSEDNIFVIGDVDDDLERMTIPFSKAIAEQSKLKDGFIDVWVNSYGGYIHTIQHFIELIELAKREGIIVRTIVPGVAMSCGSLIAVTGTPGERYVAKHAEHLLHYGSVGSINETPVQVERSRKYADRNFKWIVNHYKKYTSVPDIEEKIADDAFFVPAKDCLKWKIADKYTDRLTILEN